MNQMMLEITIVIESFRTLMTLQQKENSIESTPISNAIRILRVLWFCAFLQILISFNTSLTYIQSILIG